jgi:hypothetical protein
MVISNREENSFHILDALNWPLLSPLRIDIKGKEITIIA